MTGTSPTDPVGATPPSRSRGRVKLGSEPIEADRLFRVSREEIGQWQRRGMSGERVGVASDLGDATDLLGHYLERNRIPAVVRRPIPALDGVFLANLSGGRYRSRAGRVR